MPLYNVTFIHNEKDTHIVQDDIVRRDAIGCDKEQCLFIDLEDFANLA